MGCALPACLLPLLSAAPLLLLSLPLGRLQLHLQCVLRFLLTMLCLLPCCAVVMWPCCSHWPLAGDEASAEFAALVDKYHGAYVAALRALFEAHRERFGKGEADLQLVE